MTQGVGACAYSLGIRIRKHFIAQHVLYLFDLVSAISVNVLDTVSQRRGWVEPLILLPTTGGSRNVKKGEKSLVLRTSMTS